MELLALPYLVCAFVVVERDSSECLCLRLVKSTRIPFLMDSFQESKRKDVVQAGSVAVSRSSTGP